MWCWRSASLVRASALTWGIVLMLAAAASTTAWAAALPDGRAYELVSPAGGKNGGDVMAASDRTRVATDGNAVGFASLTAFGDPLGTGVSTEYMAIRSSDAAPATNGWVTHALTPAQTPAGSNEELAFDPLYMGDLSMDLDRGVIRAANPLTNSPSVADVPNLYVRDNLRTAGSGAYQLLTACPLCDVASTPLPPPVDTLLAPVYGGASNDFRHIVFEQRVNLTSEATPQPAGCATFTFSCRPRAYEWSDGALHIAGLVPSGSDTSCGGSGPACVVADASILGQGVGTTTSPTRPLHVISSDGSRIVFTEPTDDSGTVTTGRQRNGKLYMRTANSTTDELSASERTDCAGDPTCGGDNVPDPAPDTFLPSFYWGASADDSRVFFSTSQALTDDAVINNSRKLYMYDASKPASDPHNLVYVTADQGGGAAGTDDLQGVIGESEDGRYVYFITTAQLVAGEPSLTEPSGYFVWHDGITRFIGQMAFNEKDELLTTNNNFANPTQGRVTPDGRYLVMSSHDLSGLPVRDVQPGCRFLPVGCRRVLFVYSADTGTLACISCKASGDPPTSDAATGLRTNTSASGPTWHLNHAISDDGSRVFFTTGDALVLQDTNGKRDVYQYDVPTGQLHLITSGTDPADSYFLDATPSGSDVFFVTRERLVGWDIDSSYDLYDARVGGGFPDPLPPAARCSGSACQDGHGPAPSAASVRSSATGGAGDLVPVLKPHATAKRCKKGFVRKRVRGKSKCVKRKHRHGKHAAKRASIQQRRTK